MNARVERFNRAVQEEFLRRHENLRWSDEGGLTDFNRKLARWLRRYNGQALDGPVPIAVLAPRSRSRPRLAPMPRPVGLEPAGQPSSSTLRSRTALFPCPIAKCIGPGHQVALLGEGRL